MGEKRLLLFNDLNENWLENRMKLVYSADIILCGSLGLQASTSLLPRHEVSPDTSIMCLTSSHPPSFNLVGNGRLTVVSKEILFLILRHDIITDRDERAGSSAI